MISPAPQVTNLASSDPADAYPGAGLAMLHSSYLVLRRRNHALRIDHQHVQQ